MFRTHNTHGRGVEQLSQTFPLVDLPPFGRQEDWQDLPDGWPHGATGSGWAPSADYARYAQDAQAPSDTVGTEADASMSAR